jgi:hypothetical protein
MAGLQSLGLGGVGGGKTSDNGKNHTCLGVEPTGGVSQAHIPSPQALLGGLRSKAATQQQQLLKMDFLVQWINSKDSLSSQKAVALPSPPSMGVIHTHTHTHTHTQCSP